MLSQSYMVLIASSVLDNGSLMVNYLPSFRGSSPDGGPPGKPRMILEQRVSQQINIFGQFLALEVHRLPYVFVGNGKSLLQTIQHERPGVAAAAGAGLPVILGRPSLEVGSRASELD